MCSRLNRSCLLRYWNASIWEIGSPILNDPNCLNGNDTEDRDLNITLISYIEYYLIDEIIDKGARQNKTIKFII